MRAANSPNRRTDTEPGKIKIKPPIYTNKRAVRLVRSQKRPVQICSVPSRD